MPPFGGIKPVCHDRHKTVPEFIVILCDQMWMTVGQNLNLIYVLIEVYISGRPWQTATRYKNLYLTSDTLKQMTLANKAIFRQTYYRANIQHV